ncbi:MAG: MarR family winged helix-turn-helix transcriptional regulator [Gammaproteobacteria bacterium]
MLTESALVSIATALQRYLAPLARDAGIRWSALAVLRDLQLRGPLTQRQLATLQAVRPATMSVLVRELRTQELVAETLDPKDARRRSLHITSDGEQRLTADYERLAVPLSEVIANLSPDERHALDSALPALLRALEI